MYALSAVRYVWSSAMSAPCAQSYWASFGTQSKAASHLYDQPDRGLSSYSTGAGSSGGGDARSSKGAGGVLIFRRLVSMVGDMTHSRDASLHVVGHFERRRQASARP